jgi:putative ribosome biogenesis GTPase RsgA
MGHNITPVVCFVGKSGVGKKAQLSRWIGKKDIKADAIS